MTILPLMPAAQFLDRRGGAFNRLCQRRSKSRALQGGGSKFGQLATMSANKLVTRSDTPYAKHAPQKSTTRSLIRACLVGSGT